MAGLSTPIEVFYSYAHEDEAFRHELEKHLSLLCQQGLILPWHDRAILPGNEWVRNIDEHLNTAQVILLLISPDFLSSEYCYGIEMKRALQRHEANEACVIPILLRQVDWNSAPFAHLQALPTNANPIKSWNDQDEAFTNVAIGIRRAVEGLSSLQASASRALLPSIWNVPYPRNSFFSGREDLLASLRQQLQAGQDAALSQSQVISGLGGIGKTQVAIEYAYRHRQDYRAVFWTGADTSEALLTGYQEIARLLQLPESEALTTADEEMAHLLQLSEKDEQNRRLKVNAVIKAVQEWFRTQTGWLWILDNADDLLLVGKFLPPTFSGHILLTTREQARGSLMQCMEVDTMEVDIGALLLIHRAGLVPQDAPLESASPSDCTIAREITKELGGLPLALDQAGAYIEETCCSLSNYQVLYRMQRAKVLKRRGRLVNNHPESVVTTWWLSFQKVEQANPAAAELLRFCAFLHPDGIPEEMILEGVSEFGSLLQPFASNYYLFDEAISELRRFSFVRRKDGMISIHRLVQAVLREWMPYEVQRQWAEKVVRFVTTLFPKIMQKTTKQYLHYDPHGEVCASLIEQYQISSPVVLFVGGVPYASTQYSLEALFKKCGIIGEVTMSFDKFTNRPRGFAFVIVPNKADAQVAIKKLNGALLGGRAISVNEVRPRVFRGPRMFSGERRT